MTFDLLKTYWHVLPFLIYAVLGIKPRVLCMLAKLSPSRAIPQTLLPHLYLYVVHILYPHCPLIHPRNLNTQSNYHSG